MKPLFLPLMIAVSTTPAWAETRSYDLTGFDEIHTSDGVTVTVQVGEDFSVSAEAVRGNLDRLNIDQYGDRLDISRKRSWGILGRGKNDRFEITVTLPAIERVESNAGSSVTVARANETLVEAVSSSGSTLTLTDAVLTDVSLDASSGSTLRASGSCSHLEAEASSGSTLIATDLLCETADLDSSSGSTLRGHATANATLEASSGSSLYLTGGANISEQSTSSGASIRAD